MAAKKPGRTAGSEVGESTESTMAGTTESTTAETAAGAGTPAKNSGGAGTAARKSRSAKGAGGDATASAEGEGTKTQARTRASRKQAATADTASGAGTAAKPRKAAAKGGAKTATKRSSAKGGEAKQSGAGGGSDDLQSNLRAFVQHHPQGWGHHDWEGLLNHLRERGIDTSDEGRIGLDLERERVVGTLERSGVTGAKARSVAERFGNINDLRNASLDDLASVKGINRSQAEKIHEASR